MKQALNYLNPIAQLGKRHYSFTFPLLVMLVMCIAFEVVYVITQDTQTMGLFLIFVSLGLILYLSFRDGIKGGVISSGITILYYIYFIFARHYTGQQKSSGIETTLILGVLYLSIAGIIGWLKQTIDVLIDREADEKRRLLTIIEQLPVGILITDSKGALVESNRQLEKILGIKMPVGFVIGKDTLSNVKIDGKEITPSRSPLSLALSRGKTVTSKDLLFKRPDGREVFLRVNSAPIHNRKGQIIAAASIISDITESKEGEKRKDDFVNMASHELKTPITSLRLYIDILLKQINKKDEKTFKIGKSIAYQADRIQELVSDLLDVSRLQTGKLTFAKEEFRLDKLVEQTVNELQGITKDQKIVIDIKGVVKVNADKFRIYQVITNLITNAVKYSSSGTTITVSVEKQKDDALVSVRDEGRGIAKDQQKKIFERLYQVRSDSSLQSSGLGMGLYISREIVRKHKGTIWVESEKGKGSTFYFTLPLFKK
jgi:PAS domain S-box-containing protein